MGHQVGRVTGPDTIELLYHCLTTDGEILAGWSRGTVGVDHAGRTTLMFVPAHSSVSVKMSARSWITRRACLPSSVIFVASGYLKDVLTRLPTQRASEIDQLLPHQWMPT
ncbi:hypothetical protein ALP14_200218 [Pseudomonas amygdali pv. myricae]|nr:hypothetical protein ALP18_200077 [Pseudomonas amygdali pv. myricae]RMV21519.1 hypothetical protein ALP14_200218 [Pseudomonas amygdali pv. myricae]